MYFHTLSVSQRLLSKGHHEISEYEAKALPPSGWLQYCPWTPRLPFFHIPLGHTKNSQNILLIRLICFQMFFCVMFSFQFRFYLVIYCSKNGVKCHDWQLRLTDTQYYSPPSLTPSCCYAASVSKWSQVFHPNDATLLSQKCRLLFCAAGPGDSVSSIFFMSVVSAC